MFSDLLSSSYFQYKADTDYVAAWLATTAKECGYSADPVITDSPKHQEGEKRQGSSRMKGKARKLARAAASVASDNKDSPCESSEPAHTIAVKDFVELAKFIADYKQKPVEVPPSFVASLRRAISIRKSYGANISDNLPQTQESFESNRRHLHFICVLECVLSILSPFISDSAKSQVSDMQPPNMERLSNKFDTLELYEPSEEFLNLPDATPTATPSNSKREEKALSDDQYKAEGFQDVREVLFILRLMLQDMDDIRSVCRQTWEAYKLGKHDLITAALITNSAVEIARCMEEDAQELFDQHGGVETLQAVLYSSDCLGSEEDPEHREDPRDEFNFRVYDRIESTLWPTYCLLFHFATVSRNGAWTYQVRVPYDPSKDRSKMSNRENTRRTKFFFGNSSLRYICSAERLTLRYHIWMTLPRA